MYVYLNLLSKHRTAIMGFAILWVMAFHYPSIFDFRPLNLIKSIGYGGVDIFLFLSGFGLFFSISQKDFNLCNYYKRRFLRIMPEFWFVLIFVFGIQMDFSLNSFYNLLCNASTLGYWIWGNKIPYVLWYISCIVLFYAIFPLYFNLFKIYGIKIPLIIIFVSLFFIFGYGFVCVFFLNNINIAGLTILTYARIPIFFIGSIFGYWAKTGCLWELKKRQKLICIIYALFSFFALACFIQFFPNMLWTCSLYFIPFIIITPVLCVILAICFEKMSLSNKFFSYIGSVSLELYMCHVYSYKLFDYFADCFGKSYAYSLIIILSFISAYSLYFINKFILQKIFS